MEAEKSYGGPRIPVAVLKRIIRQHGFRTGTSQFFGQGNDRDYVVVFQDAIALDSTFEMAERYSEERKSQNPNFEPEFFNLKIGVNSKKAEFGNVYYGEAKPTEQIILDFILVKNRNQYEMWKKATETMVHFLAVFPQFSDMIKSDKSLRVGLFRQFKQLNQGE